MLTFEEAILDSNMYSKRHLLLGNGFSIACERDIFQYKSLYNQADFSFLPEIRNVFEALGSFDFEYVLKSLETTASIIPAYVDDHDPYVRKILADAEVLKDILVQTIAAHHPRLPSAVADVKFFACRKFLSHFLGPKLTGLVFTLNYDLLLYWALMHDDSVFERPLELKVTDAFGNDANVPDADYVVWQGESNAHGARVLFLHGALHLFDAGSELVKYTWKRKGIPLIDQIREALDQKKFPLFVAEGTSEQKKDKIRHNAYLYQSLKQLSANVTVARHCWFVFGHSLAENDDHILMQFACGKFAKLYVGIFGNPDSAENTEIRRRAAYLARQREDDFPLEIAFFDSASAKVWG